VRSCGHGGLHARAHGELAQHVLHVDLDGRLGNAQVAPDFLVRRAARDAAQDVLLARRQLLERRRWSAGPRAELPCSG